MGAQLDICHIKGCKTEKELRERFTETQEDLRLYYGIDPYGGHLGLKRGIQIKPKRFTADSTPQEVDDYFCQNDKWGPAWACRCVDKDGEEGWLVGGLCPS